jgi:hypothetical protein
VRANVLETIAADPGLQQTELVFLGLFGRACRWVVAGRRGWLGWLGWLGRLRGLGGLGWLAGKGLSTWFLSVRRLYWAADGRL